MTPTARLDALLEGVASLDALTALYDSLSPVAAPEMLGAWTGGVFGTSHPGERALKKLGWVGKTFRSPEDVDPIVCLDGDGQRVANPVLGAARLREMSHRGVVTATMIYDDQPILDSFRRVDDRTLLGWMDRKGDRDPLFFYLRSAATQR